MITYSRPGCGRSSPRRGRKVADAAGDVTAILDALGHDTFVTLGWSGGGPHALACGALLPDHCRAVPVSAGVGPIDAPGLDWTGGMGEENVVEFETAIRGGDELDLLLAAASDEMAKVTSVEETAAAFGELVTASDLKAFDGPVGEYLTASAKRAFLDGTEGWRDDDLAFVAPWGFEVGTMAVPVGVWQGSDDRMVPRAHGEWLGANVAEATLDVREGEGHLSIWAAVEDDLLDWLQEHLGGT